MSWIRPLAVLALLVMPLSPASAQDRYLAFGDSITDGFGDELWTEDGDPDAGYPPRLEELLSARVEKVGFGGKTTTELLNEDADNAFASSTANVLLLMAGTNDVTQRRTGTPRSVSEETSIFNLGELADRAASFGLTTTVHATTIPRSRVARKDKNNVDNQSFNQALREFAGERDRLLVDNYAVWLDVDTYPDFYFSNFQTLDPVGHPNGDGYDLMARTFNHVLRSRDRVAPVPGRMSPKLGDVDVPPNTLIEMDLWDFFSGTDLASVQLLVNGVDTGVIPQGTSRRSKLTYQPLLPLSGTVELRLRASDRSSPPNSVDRVVATFEIAGGPGPEDFDADIDQNGIVDGFDLLELTISFGATPALLRFNPRADINDDGVVDGWDLAILGANFVRTTL